jgi:uncharacterized protein (TIGR03086 family)
MTGGDASLVALHSQAVAEWLEVVRAVPDDAWDRPTPCSDWDVRALVNHVVGEQLWVPPLMEGATIEQVGDRFDGDLLERGAVTAAELAAKGATAAFEAPGALDRTVALSFGDTAAAEYGWQLTADHLVHTWDLAAAIGAELAVGDPLVRAVSTWFTGREDIYRQAGAVAERPEVPALGAWETLLVATGRDPRWTPAHDVVRRFGAAWEAWDLDAIMALMADDAVFEATGPAPDGTRIEGAPAIREAWAGMFRDTRDAAFSFEETFVDGNRATARWRFAWTNEDGSPGHVRGADVLRVRDGLVVEKLSYVKG